MFSKKRICLIVIIVLLIIVGVYGIVRMDVSYQAAYPKTPAGKIQIKVIPASLLMSTSKQGDYFDRGNELFSRLFTYINENKVSMTVPVEAEIKNARMKFYIGTADRKKNLRDGSQVTVITEKRRTVVSCGIRGGYSRTNFQKAKARLETWLQENTGYQRAGDAYAVYWNSPFMPWFLKRSEVHIPVIKRQ